MSRSTALCVVAAMCLVAAASAAELTYPMDVDCVDDDIELVVDSARVNIPGAVSYNARVYYYNGVPMVPAPTIHMKAGHYCRVTINNQLSAVGNNGCPSHLNDYHCANHTVLHTHGLHVSPYQDNIDTNVAPGQSLTYEYDIPTNHMMGTHWYHAHKHSSTAIQVTGGMAGTLFVEPSTAQQAALEGANADIGNVYADAKLLVLMHHMFGPSDGPGGFSQLSYPALSDAYGASSGGLGNVLAPEESVVTGNEDVYSVNGQLRPDVTIVSGNTQVLRMVHAAGIRVLRLVPAATGATCTYQLMARDGVFHKTPYLQVSTMVFVQGTRADYAVKCDLNAGVTEATVVFNAAPPTDPNDSLGNQNQQTQSNVFTIKVRAANGADSQLPLPTSEATFFPDYLGDISTSDAGTTFQINVGQGGGINNVRFAGFEAPEASRYMERMCVGNSDTTLPPLYFFNLNAGGGAVGPSNHPYHHHINHFQVVDASTAQFTTDAVRTGEWRDVVPSKHLLVAHRAWDFAGDIVMHCHILQHEDKGMMALYHIDECCTVATQTDDCDDNDSCTLDTCDGAGFCDHTVPAGSVGGSCTGETPNGASASGVCTAAGCDMCATVDCSAGLDAECTTSWCRLGVCYSKDAADGTTCSTGTCQGGVCTAAGCGSDSDCDDANECTADTCNVGTGVCSNAVTVGSACNGGNGACQADGTCVDFECTSAATCDDANECTADTCVGNTCVHTDEAAGTPCNGGNGACQGSGTCVDFDCTSAADCDDANECTNDSCTGNVCGHTATVGALCNANTGSCQADGTCQTHECNTNTDCTASSECFVATCTAWACTEAPKPAGAPCNGGAGACTATGACDDYECVATADCAARECHVASCDGNSCTYNMEADGTSCNGGAGTCATGTCFDFECVADSDCTAQECKAHSCSANTCAYTNVADGATCGGPGNPGTCTAGACVIAGCASAADCNDANPCTVDACSAGSCTHSGSALLDGSPCASGGSCDATGACVPPPGCNPVPNLFRYDNGSDPPMLATDDCAASGLPCPPGTPTVSAGGRVWFLVRPWGADLNAQTCPPPPPPP